VSPAPEAASAGGRAPGTAGLVLPARLEHLGEILGFVDGAARQAGAGDSDVLQLRLAVEEACVNVIRHGYAGAAQPGPIAVEVTSHEGALGVTITDRAPLFRPRDAPHPELDVPLEEREAGGLGWHLIRSSVDEVRHRPAEGGGNVLTLVKRIGETNIHH
jgi:serine/threonine-protein kinase RsbW